MKPTRVIIVLLIGLISNCMNAQESSSKIGSLPIDKKTNCTIRYYYFPNLEAYYDNLNLVYYYKQKGEWVTNEELPKNYGGYSLYNNARVAITDYEGENPFELIKLHRKIYPYNSKGRFTYASANTE